ncbi:MAG: ABC transporter permease [Solirubrobacteraceae bacterium]
MSARFHTVAAAVAWRSLHNAIVNPAILVPSIVFPLFFLIAFAGGLSALGNAPGFAYPPGYTTWQFVFVFFQSAAFGGVFTGFAIARDFESGFARRLLLAAPRRGGIVAGYALAALGRWLITGTVVTIAGFVGGMTIDASARESVTVIVLAALLNLVATLWGCGVAMRLRTEAAGFLIQIPVFIVLFVAPVFVPLDMLTGWVKAVARINPATALLEAGRSLLAGSPEKVALSLALLAIGLLVFAVWARGGLRSAERAGGAAGG